MERPAFLGREPRIERRTFLRGSLALLLLPVAWPARGAEELRPGKADLDRTLESSPYVYISPLRSDGKESACHGEVWYGWIDGAVIVNTAPSAWKTRSLERGLDRARIWVGDYGRWKKMVGRNEAFREGPSFDARAELVKGDSGLSERLLAQYEKKYPDEIGRWRDKMRDGYADGSRMLIRYTPVR